jgi:hypothetical protein
MQAACDSMCADPCKTWSIDAIIESMGGGYDPKPKNYCDISTSDVCFQYPNWNETEVYCTKAPNQDACECGTGNLVCYPLDPTTGGCYN